MGEYDGARSQWRNEPPSVLPLPVLVGTKNCVARGGVSNSNPLTSSVVGLGMFHPRKCYARTQAGPCVRINRCPDRALFAKVIALINGDDWEFYAKDILGFGAETLHSPLEDGSLFSGFGIAKLGDECHIYIDGSRNQGQLITQAYYGVYGPADYGNFTANSLYHQNALRVLRAATAFGCDTCTKFVLVGHSYGGATAAIAAAILRETQPQATLALMTFGAPRAGGPKLIEWLRPVCQRHFQRPLDPIPYLPPQYAYPTDIYALMFNLLGAIRWAAWGRYANYEPTLRLNTDGSVGEENSDAPAYDLQRTIALQIAANTYLSSYAEHAAEKYSDEMDLGCGMPVHANPVTINVSLTGVREDGFNESSYGQTTNQGCGWTGDKYECAAPFPDDVILMELIPLQRGCVVRVRVRWSYIGGGGAPVAPHGGQQWTLEFVLPEFKWYESGTTTATASLPDGMTWLFPATISVIYSG